MTKEFEVRLPQYLHLPRQLLWFDVVEVGMIVIFYLLGMVFGGFLYILMFMGPFILIPYKRGKPRGFFSHALYDFGLVEIKGYPPPTAITFHE